MRPALSLTLEKDHLPKRKKPAYKEEQRYLLKRLVAQMVKNLHALQETWVRSLGWEDLLEKGMVTHCSILAWTEEPGQLQSMGSQRVRHNWVTNTKQSHWAWIQDYLRSSILDFLWKPQTPLCSEYSLNWALSLATQRVLTSTSKLEFGCLKKIIHWWLFNQRDMFKGRF